MSKKTLKEFIIECIAGDDVYDTEALYETLDAVLECTVWRGEEDRHRWYTLTPYVFKVIIDNEERFFLDTEVFVYSEDSDRDDCGQPYPDLDDLREVYPKEIVTTIYIEGHL